MSRVEVKDFFFFFKKRGGIRAYMIFYANTYTFELYRKADGKF